MNKLTHTGSENGRILRIQFSVFWFMILESVRGQGNVAWDRSNLAAFGSYTVLQPYVSLYSVNGVCQMWTDTCASRTKMTTDIQMLDSSGSQPYQNISLSIRAHNNSCSDMSNPVNYRFRYDIQPGVSVNEMWAQLTGTSISASYPWSFATANRPLSVIIHDPSSDQCMFCCDLRYLGDQVCSKPKSPCNGKCASWAIGSILIGSFLLTTAFAHYLKSRNLPAIASVSGDKNIESIPEDAKEEGDAHGGGHHHSGGHHESEPAGVGLSKHAPTQNSAQAAAIAAHAAAPAPAEVHAAVNLKSAKASAASLNGDSGAPTAEPADDDVMAALDSIKELELLSKINDLEHELLTVEISTKSPSRERASLATN